jgi:ribosomal protein S18 acetylase RimI-like enzyme
MRRASPTDIEVVKTISADAFLPYEATIGIVPGPAVEDYRPRIARGEVWLLEDGDDAIGVVVLEERPRHVAIYSIAVMPDRQRSGYGRALLAFAEERARAIGVGEVRLYTNQRMERNIAIYERWGFVHTGTRPHPTRPGHVMVDMAKRIAP